MKKPDLKPLTFSPTSYLLPMIVSVIFYNSLSKNRDVHWDFYGRPNEYVHKSWVPFKFLTIYATLRVIICFPL